MEDTTWKAWSIIDSGGSELKMSVWPYRHVWTCGWHFLDSQLLKIYTMIVSCPSANITLNNGISVQFNKYCIYPNKSKACINAWASKNSGIQQSKVN